MKIDIAKLSHLARGRLHYVGVNGQDFWVLGEADDESAPLEPVGNLIEIMRALQPSPITKLRYRSVDIPMAAALSAYDTFKRKEGEALDDHGPRLLKAIEKAAEAGMALGEFVMHVGRVYEEEITALRLLKIPELHTVFYETFLERLRAF